MFTNYGLKVLKLAIIILNASYFAGMFWLIFCELTLYFSKDDAYVQITQLLEKPKFAVDKCGIYDDVLRKFSANAVMTNAS